MTYFAKITRKKNGHSPDWVEQYHLGDQITYYDPQLGRNDTGTIIGFSTKRRHRGVPVIEAKEHHDCDHVAITQKYVRMAKEVPQEGCINGNCEI